MCIKLFFNYIAQPCTNKSVICLGSFLNSIWIFTIVLWVVALKKPSYMVFDLVYRRVGFFGNFIFLGLGGVGVSTTFTKWCNEWTIHTSYLCCQFLITIQHFYLLSVFSFWRTLVMWNFLPNFKVDTIIYEIVFNG